MRNNCPNCGATLAPVGDAFCPECRTPLDEPPEEETGGPPSTPQAETERDDDLSNICPDCGTANAADAAFCESCGKALSEKQSNDDPMFGDAAEQFPVDREINAPEDAAPWRCLECQEPNPGNFDNCWNCGAPATSRVERLIPESEASLSLDAVSEDPKAAEVFVSKVLEQLNQSNATGGSWMHSILVLGMTLVLFSLAGLFSFGLAELLLIVVVLMVHESGHYLGMRLFNYQNVRMFFIPFFGAAVSGRKAGISAFKEAIVILLGPLPGIAIGIVLGVLATHRSDKLLVDASQMFVIINAFNLLPFLPLDGGRLLHLVLFSRQRHIEAVFQIVAGGALAVLGWSLDAWLLAGLGGLMVFTTSASFRICSMAQELRAKTATDPVPEDGQTTIPRKVVVRIIEMERERMPTMTDPKTLAALIRSVWERLVAKPPGIATSLFLLGIYAAALVAAILSVGALGSITMGNLEPLDSSRVLGRHFAYTVHSPEGNWFRRQHEDAVRDNPLADMWLVNLDYDAHIVVIVQTAPVGFQLAIDEFIQAVIARAFYVQPAASTRRAFGCRRTH